MRDDARDRETPKMGERERQRREKKSSVTNTDTDSV